VDPPVDIDLFGRWACIIDEKPRIRFGFRSPVDYHGFELRIDVY